MSNLSPVAVLMDVEHKNRINCTGPGEVGCAGRIGWHSWVEHRRHVAADQVAALVAAGFMTQEMADV